MTSTRNDENPWVAAQGAILQETMAHLRRLGRLPFLWQHAQRVKEGSTPSEVVYEEDDLKVLHYLSDQPPKHATPMCSSLPW